MHFSVLFLSSSFLGTRHKIHSRNSFSLCSLSLFLCVCVCVCVLLKKTLLMSRLANRAFRSLVAGSSSTSSSGSSVMSSINSSFRKLHHHRLKRSYGATPKGSYFSEGTQTKRNGLLFGETPPLKGTKRIRESWELPYFATFLSAGVILYVGLNRKPDTSLVGWAKEEARKRLEKEEDER